ncbi:transcriptional repressor [Desulfovibrionales bacterium]
MKESLGEHRRLTNQRKLILKQLQSVTSHPTADELYDMVRQHMPRISLGTVYRNLETLSALGLVRKLDNASGQKRFDGDMSSHHHIRCERCGKIGDIFGAPDISDIEKGIQTDFTITGHCLEFSGICPQCQCSGHQSH